MGRVRWVFVGVLFVSFMVQAFLAMAVFMRMIDLVNDRLPPDEQISQIGANVRMFRILELYMNFYPDGKLRARLNRLAAGAIFCFILTLQLLFAH